MIIVTVQDIIAGALIAALLLVIGFQWVLSWFDKKD
jgi:hypothetical protein